MKLKENLAQTELIENNSITPEMEQDFFKKVLEILG